MLKSIVLLLKDKKISDQSVSLKQHTYTFLAFFLTDPPQTAEAHLFAQSP